MIPSQDHNHVHFSNWITDHKAYAPAGKRIIDALVENNIPHSFLKETNDIWVKDFMPKQVSENQFLGFRYEPKYHLKKDYKYRTNPKTCCKANDIDAAFSNINLDGGNVVGWYDKAFISERVFKDNDVEGTEEKRSLISELEKALNVRIIWLPDPEDYTGHADGFIRWVNSDTVLTWNLDLGVYPEWERKTKQVLKENRIRNINMPSYETQSEKSAIGCYVNYLQLKDFILFPVFEQKPEMDAKALEQIGEVFPYSKIVPININEIAKDGGLLNCCSWGVERSKMIANCDLNL